MYMCVPIYAPGDTTRRCLVSEGRCGKHQARDRVRRYACPYPRGPLLRPQSLARAYILLYVLRAHKPGGVATNERSCRPCLSHCTACAGRLLLDFHRVMLYITTVEPYNYRRANSSAGPVVFLKCARARFAGREYICFARRSRSV